MEDTVNKRLLREAPGAEEVVDGEKPFKDRIWTESKKMWIVAGPAIFTRFSTMGVSIISQAFIGHVGSLELAAYALVSTVFLRFAIGILLGMASGLETLCGQSSGAKQYDMLGVYLQRSWLILFICSIVLSPIFIFTTPILIALGQDEFIAEVAGTIALWSIPVIFSFIVSFSCQMLLQAQSKNLIIAYLAAFSLAIHVFLSWLLTVKYNFGLSGAMISTIFDSIFSSQIGSLPSTFGNMKSIEKLNVAQNSFTQVIPAAICQLILTIISLEKHLFCTGANEVVDGAEIAFLEKRINALLWNALQIQLIGP
ncbi:Multidrug resistance pump [Heracleum sosnowskyi]|uniref:Multidrug resistance pump n=1 Tax=Heracleum sosnowskyi TaxID=360622 RepID=A0AAD8ITZ1_9APIA|nr:Multidrug resistance pump [Heracleum sosnowskyi]